MLPLVSRVLSRLVAALRVLLLLALSAAFLFPFVWMVVTSLKGADQVYQFPPSLIPRPVVWQNYVAAWRAAPMLHYFLNSVLITGSVLVLQILLCSLAAYAFAHIDFPGRNLVFGIVLLALMVPGQVTFLPNFLLLKEVKLLNTYGAMIIPALGSAFGIFLFRQRFLQVPREIIEAARLEGASELQVLRHVMVPLALPIAVTFALFTFVAQWNDYFWPLVVTNDDAVRPLAIGLAQMTAQTESAGDWNLMMAANMFLVVPVVVVFLFARRHLVRAFITGGIK